MYIKMLTGNYQKNKERFQKKVLERYQNLSEENENKNHQYPREWYRNFLGDKKQKLVKYTQNHSKIQKIKTSWV